MRNVRLARETIIIVARPAAFKGRGVDLEVEGVRYIEMHRGPRIYVLDQPTSFKGQRSRTRGRSQCVLVKIWRSIYTEHLFGLASRCRCYINRRYKTFVITLHCALDSGTDLRVK